MINNDNLVKVGEVWRMQHTANGKKWKGRITVMTVSGEYYQSYRSEKWYHKALLIRKIADEDRRDMESTDRPS
jgi:hypothetical protein